MHRTIGARTFVQRANIAAGAERFGTRTAQDDRLNLAVSRPARKPLRHAFDHAVSERVQRLGTIEGEVGDTVADVDEKFVVLLRFWGHFDVIFLATGEHRSTRMKGVLF
jgi:hypothetical protein